MYLAVDHAYISAHSPGLSRPSEARTQALWVLLVALNPVEIRNEVPAPVPAALSYVMT